MWMMRGLYSMLGFRIDSAVHFTVVRYGKKSPRKSYVRREEYISNNLIYKKLSAKLS